MSRIGTVVITRSGFVDVSTAEGRIQCRVRGRLKRGKARSDLCVVGDEVRVTQSPEGTWVVEEVMPRRTRFSRKHPGAGNRVREDVIVANLDRILCVFSYGAPAMNPRLLDRFLVVADHNRIDALIVANKVDLADDATRALFAAYEPIGYPVLHTSAVTGEGMDALREHLSSGISALAGPSGVGKSSLLNTIDPSLDLAVGATSEAVQKGKHTTRVAALHDLAGGGAVVDTPGIRELAAFQIPPDELAGCFPEMRPHLGTCAFGDCTHVHEPNCSVRAAVDAGDITGERYDSYMRILRGEERG